MENNMDIVIPGEAVVGTGVGLAASLALGLVVSAISDTMSMGGISAVGEPLTVRSYGRHVWRAGRVLVPVGFAIGVVVSFIR